MSLFHTRSRHQSAGWHVVAADFLILSRRRCCGGTRQTRLPTSSATSPGLVDSKPYGAAQRSSVRTDKACQHIHWLSSGPPAGKGDEDHLITTPWSPVPRHMFSQRAPPGIVPVKKSPMRRQDQVARHQYLQNPRPAQLFRYYWKDRTHGHRRSRAKSRLCSILSGAPAPSRAAADALCEKILRAGGACVVRN